MSDTNQQIIPMLSYEDGVAAIDWLCKAFGFTEKTRWLDDNGRLTHGEIEIANNIIMLASPTPNYQSPNHHRINCEAAAKWYRVPYIINDVMVCVDDVEKHFKTAKENGAIERTRAESKRRVPMFDATYPPRSLSTSMTLQADAQNRIDATMFLPTPNRATAPSSAKTAVANSGCVTTAS